LIDHYDWAGGREAMLRFGPASGPVVVAALPLFEEANRTRAFVVTILRGLARRGIGSALPDLPGTGESLIPTADATLTGWRTAYAAAVASLGGTALSAAFRGGALIDGEASVAGRWQLAPVEGSALVRDMMRTRLTAADGSDGDPDKGVIELAGNVISRTLLTDLEQAEPSDGRVVRLDSDPREADLKLPGAPLWRRAEPGNDPELADLIADDIAAWVRSCVG
jgi:hypothetical protein